MSDKCSHRDASAEVSTVTFPATVEKVIPSRHAGEPDKAQIALDNGEDLYREIRIENTLKDDRGKPVELKEGAEVKVTIAAEPEATVKKN